jgi:hypothetical protein
VTKINWNFSHQVYFRIIAKWKRGAVFDPNDRPDEFARSRRSLVKAATILMGVLPCLALTSRKANAGVLSDLLRDLRRRPVHHKCFLRGTRIRTLTGYRPVEDLSAGDVLPTAFGGPSPIREVRRFRVERQDRNEPWPLSAMPVRIRASALEDNVPRADLYVSAAHSLYIDGVLVPAWNLVNGTSITRDDARHLKAIEYFHIILDRHDVVDAEGASCDTFWEAIDDVAPADGRGEEIHGAILPPVCAPLASYGRRRNVIKSRLRSALSPIVDVRRPLDRIRDRIEERIAC